MTSSIKGKIAVLRDIFESVILKLNENNFDTTIARRMEIIHSRIEELHKAYKPNEEVSYEQMRTTVNDLIELTEHGDFYAVLESILTKDERTILESILNSLRSHIAEKVANKGQTSEMKRQKLGELPKHLVDDVNDSIRGNPRLISEAKKLSEKLENFESKLLKKEVDLSTKFAQFENTLEELNSQVSERIGKLDSLIVGTESELDEKKAGIDAQLGTLTAATMAKDYAEFADIEKGIADEYRRYSLWAMFGVAAVVAFTIWQSAKGEFTITESLIRLSFILIISAPAIYLSRESAKHRNQENQHRQTNLDLRAITPYIASLSKTEQSQLKTQIALRLFGARNNSPSHKEEIPINVNDLLLKLLDKVDLSGKPEKATKID